MKSRWKTKPINYPPTGGLIDSAASGVGRGDCRQENKLISVSTVSASDVNPFTSTKPKTKRISGEEEKPQRTNTLVFFPIWPFVDRRVNSVLFPGHTRQTPVSRNRGREHFSKVPLRLFHCNVERVVDNDPTRSERSFNEKPTRADQCLKTDGEINSFLPGRTKMNSFSTTVSCEPSETATPSSKYDNRVVTRELTRA